MRCMSMCVLKISAGVNLLQHLSQLKPHIRCMTQLYQAFWKYHLGWMCCNTGHNINLVAFHPGRPYGPYQITILRHQVHTMVIMIINNIIKIVTIFINILNILISSMMMMMMKSGGFSYGGFSYILCSYILRSYFGCTPTSPPWSSSPS